MKNNVLCLFIIIIFFAPAHTFCQTKMDKTNDWSLLQRGNEKIILTNNSNKTGEYYYEQILINPKSVKNLHVTIGSINLDDAGYKTDDFVVQIFSRKKTWITDYQKYSFKFEANILTENTDTLAVRISIFSAATFKKRFFIEYIFADTAAYSYASFKPKEVFIKMLEMAQTNFLNLPLHDPFLQPSIEYPNGLFAKGKASRVGGSFCETTQITGTKLESRAEADAMNAKWNKQIIEWLKEYDVNDIKKIETGKKELNSDEEETIYIKNNTEGKRLFKITVYKRVKGDGTENDPMSYETGVVIGL